MSLCETQSVLPSASESCDAASISEPSDAHFLTLIQQYGSLRHEKTGRRASFVPVPVPFNSSCNASDSRTRTGIWRGSNGSYIVFSSWALALEMMASMFSRRFNCHFWGTATEWSIRLIGPQRTAAEQLRIGWVHFACCVRCLEMLLESSAFWRSLLRSLPSLLVVFVARCFPTRWHKKTT